jgi:hypothetical protein
VLDEIGPFRADLGRIGDGLLSSEETEVVDRLWARSHLVAYAPRAEVRHRVTAERTTMSWLRRRAYWGGVSYVLTDDVSNGSSRAEIGRTGRARCVAHRARGAHRGSRA